MGALDRLANKVKVKPVMVDGEQFWVKACPGLLAVELHKKIEGLKKEDEEADVPFDIMVDVVCACLVEDDQAKVKSVKTDDEREFIESLPPQFIIDLFSAAMEATELSADEQAGIENL